MAEARTQSGTLFTNAAAYDRMMGRWSRRLAPLLVGFGGCNAGDRVLDVGCGTGSLAFALPRSVGQVTGIDKVGAYVAEATRLAPDGRFRFQEGDACALPFAAASFERAYCMLVLQFIPDAAKAVAEMRRVVRPGGMVTAAIWDAFGGMTHTRMVWDIAATLDPAIVPMLIRPLGQPGEMEAAWREAGLVDIERTELVIRFDFASFEDYWEPLTEEGPVSALVRGLSADLRAKLVAQVRRAYCANLPEGPRSFAGVAWACRGTVPAT